MGAQRKHRAKRGGDCDANPLPTTMTTFYPRLLSKRPASPLESGDSEFFTVQSLPRPRAICRISTYIYGLSYERELSAFSESIPGAYRLATKAGSCAQEMSRQEESAEPRKDISFLYDVCY